MMFLWVLDGDPRAIIKAGSEEEAHRKAIALRITEGGQTAKEAIRWFNHHDEIYRIDDIPTTTCEPYAGPIDGSDDNGDEEPPY